MMEAVHTSETSGYFNEPTWHYIQEACHLQEVNIAKKVHTSGITLMNIFWMLCCVVSLELTDISEVLTVSIIRAGSHPDCRLPW
jgi:uncharacterized membrane protein YccF (DUF307 family)